MPLILSTPKNTGDLDPNTSEYGEVKIVRFVHDAVRYRIELRCQYGNTVSGSWVPGILPFESHVIRNIPETIDENNQPVPADPQYYTMVTQMPNEGETIYVAAGRELYEWLIGEGVYSGTYTF